jgi:uncharacterized hydantoinase/oxoprolinase family protein
MGLAVTSHKVFPGNYGVAECTVAESPPRVDAFRDAAGQDESVARVDGNQNVRVTRIVFVLGETSCHAGKNDVKFVAGSAWIMTVNRVAHLLKNDAIFVGVETHNRVCLLYHSPTRLCL